MIFDDMAAVMGDRHTEEDDRLEYIKISGEQGAARRSAGRARRRAGGQRENVVDASRGIDVISGGHGVPRQGGIQRVISVPGRDGTPRSAGDRGRAGSPQGGGTRRAVRVPDRDGTPRSGAGSPQGGGARRVVSVPGRDGTPRSAGDRGRAGSQQGGGARRVVSVPGRDGTPRSAENQRRADKPQSGKVQGDGYGTLRLSGSVRRDVRPRQGGPSYQDQRRYSRRRRRRKKGSAAPMICLFFLVVLVLGIFVYINSLVYRRCRVQAGTEVRASDFFRNKDENAYFTQDSAPFDIYEPGEYKVRVKSGLFTYRCTLIVEDTKAPTAQAVQKRIGVGETCEPEDFVEDIVDNTAVTVAFVTQPDFGQMGRQPVRVSLTDKGNNTTIIDSELYISTVLADVYVEMGGTAPSVDIFLLASQSAYFVTDMDSLDYNRPADYIVSLMVDGEEETSTLHVVDKEPPVITGAADLEIYTGDGVAYRKSIEVTDNWPENLSLEVDSSQVNVDAVGVYPVTYTATDAAGNTSSVTVHLTVKARAYDVETVNELADAVLAEIITPDMSQLEKAHAIYDYNMSHIGYIEHSEKGDWVRAAYEGLTLGRGDCYVYACTAKLLLTRAGINNMDIVKIPSDSEHYWNLVDVGDGWYHFDTTPRKDHPTIFMWTEEQMMEYSAAHQDSHNYDHDDYPEVN